MEISLEILEERFKNWNAITGIKRNDKVLASEQDIYFHDPKIMNHVMRNWPSVKFDLKGKQIYTNIYLSEALLTQGLLDYIAAKNWGERRRETYIFERELQKSKRFFGEKTLKELLAVGEKFLIRDYYILEALKLPPSQLSDLIAEWEELDPNFDDHGPKFWKSIRRYRRELSRSTAYGSSTSSENSSLPKNHPRLFPVFAVMSDGDIKKRKVAELRLPPNNYRSDSGSPRFLRQKKNFAGKKCISYVPRIVRHLLKLNIPLYMVRRIMANCPVNEENFAFVFDQIAAIFEEMCEMDVKMEQEEKLRLLITISESVLGKKMEILPIEGAAAFDKLSEREEIAFARLVRPCSRLEEQLILRSLDEDEVKVFMKEIMEKKPRSGTEIFELATNIGVARTSI